MRKLKLEVQLSIDGFVADINGSTHWLIWNWTDEWTWDEELRKYHINLTTTSDCILLGRKMADGFVRHWEKVVEHPDNLQYEFAKPITEMQKVVFTKTLTKSEWKNTEIVRGDFVNEINRLKNQEGKDIIVYGGAEFVSSLIKARIIDEYYLFINPAVLGNGKTIFKELESIQNLTLTGAKSYPCGVVVLTYVKNDR